MPPPPPPDDAPVPPIAPLGMPPPPPASKKETGPLLLPPPPRSTRPVPESKMASVATLETLPQDEQLELSIPTLAPVLPAAPFHDHMTASASASFSRPQRASPFPSAAGALNVPTVQMSLTIVTPAPPSVSLGDGECVTLTNSVGPLGAVVVPIHPPVSTVDIADVAVFSASAGRQPAPAVEVFENPDDAAQYACYESTPFAVIGDALPTPAIPDLVHPLMQRVRIDRPIVTTCGLPDTW